MSHLQDGKSASARASETSVGLDEGAAERVDDLVLVGRLVVQVLFIYTPGVALGRNRVVEDLRDYLQFLHLLHRSTGCFQRVEEPGKAFVRGV